MLRSVRAKSLAVITGGLVIATACGLCPATGVAAGRCESARPAIVYRPGGRGHVPGLRARLIPCRYTTGAESLEPSVSFTNGGRILFQAWELQAGTPGGVPPVPRVLRSSGSFTSWQDISPLGPAQSLDPYLTVDHRTGRIFTVNYLADAQPTCATISYSDNEGESWTSSPVAGCGGFDGESIAAGPPVSSQPVGYPDLVYFCTGTVLGSGPPTTTPICEKSFDGGLTFQPTGTSPFPLYNEQAEGDKFGPWAGNPVVGPDGAVYVPKRFAGQPEVAVSHDEGLTWQDIEVAHNGAGGETPRMAIDRAGDIFYAWVSARRLPYLAFSRDDGQTWSAPIAVAPRGLRQGLLPRVAATGNGRVMIAYIGSQQTREGQYYPFCDALLEECTDGVFAGVEWNGYMTLIEDALITHPKLETGTVDPPSQPLLVGGCSADGGCKANLDFIGAEFGPEGDGYAAFVDDCTLERGFLPIFGAALGQCGDYVGEGIVGRLARGSRHLEP
jgi:hypothetical protein